MELCNDILLIKRLKNVYFKTYSQFLVNFLNKYYNIYVKLLKYFNKFDDLVNYITVLQNNINNTNNDIYVEKISSGDFVINKQSIIELKTQLDNILSIQYNLLIDFPSPIVSNIVFYNKFNYLDSILQAINNIQTDQFYILLNLYYTLMNNIIDCQKHINNLKDRKFVNIYHRLTQIDDISQIFYKHLKVLSTKYNTDYNHNLMIFNNHITKVNNMISQEIYFKDNILLYKNYELNDRSKKLFTLITGQTLD